MKSSECFTIDISVQQDKPLVKKIRRPFFALNKAMVESVLSDNYESRPFPFCP